MCIAIDVFGGNFVPEFDRNQNYKSNLGYKTTTFISPNNMRKYIINILGFDLFHLLRVICVHDKWVSTLLNLTYFFIITWILLL